MKTNALLIAVVVAASTLHAQSTFQNLDFEQATIVPIGPGFLPIVEASSAIPGWTAYNGNNPDGAVLYNSLTLGGAAVSIHDSASLSLQPLQGNYSIGIQHSTGGTSTTAAIGQTGQLPANAFSLIFNTRFFNPNQFEVMFAGNSIPIIELGSAPGYFTLGGDISAYAGQTGELRFTALQGALFLDNIQFSNQAVPEPGVLGLSVLGGLLLGWRWQREHS